MDPLVSVVITTHNRVNLLARAIDSVLNQTYSSIQCIVVSDASTDDTVKYCSSKPNIIFHQISKENSRGGNHARNIGIGLSSGEYIAFLDDDDEWFPDKVEKQMAHFIGSQVGFVYCGRIRRYIKCDGTSYDVEQRPKKEVQGDVKKSILYNIATTTSCVLVKKELLCQTGLFDENLNFWQEYELSIRLAQITQFGFVDEPLCIYRVDQQDRNRLTNKYRSWKAAVKYIRKKHENLYSKLTVDEWRRFYIMYWNDAITRCTASNDKFKVFWYKIGVRLLNLPSHF